jgi:hypothetical protein
VYFSEVENSLEGIWLAVIGITFFLIEF